MPHAAVSTATVTALSGRAWMRQADGLLIELRPNAVVAFQREIVTAAGAMITLTIDGVAPITIDENRRVVITDALAAPADPSEAVRTPVAMTDLRRLLRMLEPTMSLA